MKPFELRDDRIQGFQNFYTTFEEAVIDLTSPECVSWGTGAPCQGAWSTREQS